MASVLETPFDNVNAALGGSLPSGGVALFVGPKASLKTTLALHLAYHATRECGEAVLWLSAGEDHLHLRERLAEMDRAQRASCPSP